MLFLRARERTLFFFGDRSFMTISIQKANFWKRFSAWLVDTVLVILLAIACALPLLDAFQLDANGTQLIAVQEQYKTTIEAEYSVDLDITDEEYEKLPESQKQIINNAKTALSEALGKDETFIRLRADRLTIILGAGALALFSAVLLAHFILPLILKNGQTLGKKTFGLALVKTDCIKVSAPILFVRSIIGLLTVETMAFAFLLMIVPVGIIAAILLQALQVFVLIKTDTNAAIHDLLASTAVVDLASQHIFETEEERTQFIAKAQAQANASAEHDVN